MSRLPVVANDAGAWGTILNEYLTEHVVPTGGMLEYAGAAAPTGFLLCDGTSYLRADYNDLFTALGGASSPWGLPDGTHFNVPDMRGRVTVGKGSNAAVDALGESDGVSEPNRRPQHRHTPHWHTLDMDSASYTTGTADSANFGEPPASHPGYAQRIMSTADGGSGISTDALDAPAYVVVNYIIKT